MLTYVWVWSRSHPAFSPIPIFSIMEGGNPSYIEVTWSTCEQHCNSAKEVSKFFLLPVFFFFLFKVDCWIWAGVTVASLRWILNLTVPRECSVDSIKAFKSTCTDFQAFTVTTCIDTQPPLCCRGSGNQRREAVEELVYSRFLYAMNPNHLPSNNGWSTHEIDKA